MKEIEIEPDPFKGLESLIRDAFPRRCSGCGRIYHTPQDYLAETLRLRPSCTGLQAVEDDQGMVIVELFRNCRCGSTLMDMFIDRRDISFTGIRRRRLFASMLDSLAARGLDRPDVREELLTVARGGDSELLARLGILFRRP